MKCVVCHQEKASAVRFPCPRCKFEMMRCDSCSRKEVEYCCPQCGYLSNQPEAL